MDDQPTKADLIRQIDELEKALRVADAAADSVIELAAELDCAAVHIDAEVAAVHIDAEEYTRVIIGALINGNGLSQRGSVTELRSKLG
jgi:hypothetical protein